MGGRVGLRGGGQGGCERGMIVFEKIHKENRGGVRVGGCSGCGGGVRVDVNEELKFL